MRFEGEPTLLELADHIGNGTDWRAIAGIVYQRRRRRDRQTGPRDLLRDLDDLPYPDREFEPEQVLGRSIMPILASRGCARTCSFCSIHTFYRTAPGKVVRTRKPARGRRGDALAARRRAASRSFFFRTTTSRCSGRSGGAGAQLHRRTAARRSVGQGDLEDELPRRRCRPRTLHRDARRRTLSRLHGPRIRQRARTGDAEQGDHGRAEPDSRRHAEALRAGVRIRLHAARPVFELRVDSRQLRFLRTIAGDGCVAAVFCRMLPYDGTPIKDELAAEGRLKRRCLQSRLRFP